MQKTDTPRLIIMAKTSIQILLIMIMPEASATARTENPETNPWRAIENDDM